ncbi:histone deacetylase 2 [Phtheirospermum japonicum]|uniref:Histone deacetylase 2 n=1 Tax=Phtheirospermum japonicum TaxID=374723 RepID=A0A830D159_9LAMI|nr:histone deacetylase 2 [Phtheirospermum japonicum]
MATAPHPRTLSTCQSLVPIHNKFSTSPPINSLAVPLSFNLRHSIRRAFSVGEMAAPSSSSVGGGSSNTAAHDSNGGESARRDRILSSKLYFDVHTPKVPLIYSSSYDIAFLGIEKLHPFDSSKWGRICRFLIAEDLLDKKHLIEPLEAEREDLLVVPPVAILPNCLVDKHVLYPFRKQVGGTILAAKVAKERGWAINVGGGFHHCSAEKGGGFCAYADISLCIHFAFVRLNISRVMIIDLDAHQGNGHEKDFSDDRRVYILDIYNPDIYPFDYEARRNINQKVEVASGTATNEYLSRLEGALKVAADAFDPELIIYNAGSDILDGDPLGRLKISPDGIATRDEKVFMFARERDIPLVMLTSDLVNFVTKGFETPRSRLKEERSMMLSSVLKIFHFDKVKRDLKFLFTVLQIKPFLVHYISPTLPCLIQGEGAVSMDKAWGVSVETVLKINIHQRVKRV